MRPLCALDAWALAADVWGRLSGSQESVAGVSGRSDREHAPMIGLATALEAVAWL